MKKAFAAGLLFIVSAVSIGAQRTDEIHQKVQKIASNKDGKIQVKLLDGTRLKGIVTSVETSHFTVIEDKTNLSRTIAYADVDSVKKPHSGLKPLTWAVIAGAAAATIIVAVTVLQPVLCDGGAGC